MILYVRENFSPCEWNHSMKVSWNSEVLVATKTMRNTKMYFVFISLVLGV